MSAFVCANPQCDRDERRMIIGYPRGLWLIIAPDVEAVMVAPDRWRVQCPQCGRWRDWTGKVARAVETRAA